MRKWLKRKHGPLAMWAWLVVAAGGVWAYRRHTPGTPWPWQRPQTSQQNNAQQYSNTTNPYGPGGPYYQPGGGIPVVVGSGSPGASGSNNGLAGLLKLLREIIADQKGNPRTPKPKGHHPSRGHGGIVTMKSGKWHPRHGASTRHDGGGRGKGHGKGGGGHKSHKHRHSGGGNNYQKHAALPQSERVKQTGVLGDAAFTQHPDPSPTMQRRSPQEATYPPPRPSSPGASPGRPRTTGALARPPRPPLAHASQHVK